MPTPSSAWCHQPLASQRIDIAPGRSISLQSVTQPLFAIHGLPPAMMPSHVLLQRRHNDLAPGLGFDVLVGAVELRVAVQPKNQPVAILVG